MQVTVNDIDNRPSLVDSYEVIEETILSLLDNKVTRSRDSRWFTRWNYGNCIVYYIDLQEYEVSYSPIIGKLVEALNALEAEELTILINEVDN